MSYKIIKLNSKEDFLTDQISSEYWNDQAEEKDKVFNVIDNGFNKIESSKKYRDLLESISEVLIKHKINFNDSKILSVGAGICWVESQLLKGIEFKNIACIDFSSHRIHKLAPFTMKHYDVKRNVSFLHGNVFDLDIQENKYDIVLLSQAFHHIEEPIRLLRFLKQSLTDDGCIIIVGEHFYTNLEYHKRALKHFVKYLINWNDYKRLKNFILHTKTFFNHVLKREIYTGQGQNMISFLKI